MSAVVFIAEGTPRALRDEVEAACSALDVPSLTLRPGAPPVDDGAAADATSGLIFAPLRAGSRRIPLDILDAAERAGERTTLVLFASEPLVRPAVTLDEGRVVVLGPSSGARVHALVRMLLPSTRPRLAGGARWTTQLDVHAWTAHSGASRCVHDADGFSALIRFDGTSADGHLESDDALLVELCAADEERFAALAASAGPDVALVRMSRAEGAWLISWPRADRLAWLTSPVRLPNVVDVAATAARSERGVLRLPAYPGDCAFAFAGPVEGEIDVPRTAQDGAAAVLGRVEWLASARGLLAEVR